MRKIWRSSNTSPTPALISRADSRSVPIGFSSTMRVSPVIRPASAMAWLMST